ncbi:glycosyltransferase [Pedobacter sp. SD-b]|uniref:Glycosyltransferase n=1 Tax=Pedobacter segetis TaxID=2793069 RepID=A0ABS1BGR6_9SPHI|nr:glycosyltransferase [Pedobacter segetis]MBK0382058.1 glycosyltransferase [Pedobacter segetis]
MRIGFVVNHPTQFEVPFYQYVAKNFPHDEFEIFYLKEQENQHYDNELRQSVKWGFDLFEGYPFLFLPQEGKLSVFREKLKEKTYNLIIINGYKNQYAGFAAICKGLKIKVALKLDSVLFNQPFYKIWLRKIFLKKEYKKFDHFLVTGKVSKDYCLEMGIPENQINLFSYCVDNSYFNLSGKEDSDYFKKIKQKYQPNHEIAILSVAKFVGRESPWDILRAFVKLGRKDLVLILIGDGNERGALEKFAQKKAHLKIFFPGYIPYQHLPEFYKLSSIFIHAAKDEPWGVSVQEAIAGDCFVICSDKVGAAQDLLVEGENGFTYQYGNSEELADDIATALNIPKEKIKNANEKILNKWNYHTMWQEIISASK